jgi:hypothetical protein
MATTTTNLAFWTAYCRRHAGIAERLAYCCHTTTSMPRTRPPLPASSTPALPRPPPGAHGQPSRVGVRPAGRLPSQPCHAGACRHRATSCAAKLPPLSASSHHLHAQPPFAAWCLRHHVRASASRPSLGVNPAPCHHPRVWEQPPPADPAVGTPDPHSPAPDPAFLAGAAMSCAPLATEAAAPA